MPNGLFTVKVVNPEGKTVYLAVWDCTVGRDDIDLVKHEMGGFVHGELVEVLLECHAGDTPDAKAFWGTGVETLKDAIWNSWPI